ELGATGHELYARLAEAHANAGHGREAARAFLTAAETAPRTESLDYQRCAAEELLQSGHVSEGEEVLARVCDQVSFELPAPTALRSGLLSLVALRARLRLRGLRYRERDPAEIAPVQLQRID